MSKLSSSGEGGRDLRSTVFPVVVILASETMLAKIRRPRLEISRWQPPNNFGGTNFKSRNLPQNAARTHPRSPAFFAEDRVHAV